MVWACFQAGSLPFPVILIGVSVKRHSNVVGGFFDDGCPLMIAVPVTPIEVNIATAQSKLQRTQKDFSIMAK
jgi:hypothetical protein